MVAQKNQQSKRDKNNYINAGQQYVNMQISQNFWYSIYGTVGVSIFHMETIDWINNKLTNIPETKISIMVMRRTN